RSLYLIEIIQSRVREPCDLGAVAFGMARAIRDGRQGGAKKSSRGQSIPDSKISGGKRTMSVEKKSLINNMTATKKALIATTPSSSVASSKPAVGLSKFSKGKGEVGLSKFSKDKGLVGLSKFSKK